MGWNLSDLTFFSYLKSIRKILSIYLESGLSDHAHDPHTLEFVNIGYPGIRIINYIPEQFYHFSILKAGSNEEAMGDSKADNLIQRASTDVALGSTYVPCLNIIE